MRVVEDVFELYLEYADGGELFDQIEPDYGMEPIKAQFFFRQLLNGLAYIHSCGIAHRDIKPENLLLTKDNVLKISDFGMATAFRQGNDERWLNTRCGTMPYAAPEVLTGKYHGEPADVWSCGVVLVTMLVGELPWAAPKMDSLDFKEYVENNALQNRPWCRLDTIELSLLSMIFNRNPTKRATISRIKKHPWYIGKLGNQANWKREIFECDSSDIVQKKNQTCPLVANGGGVYDSCIAKPASGGSTHTVELKAKPKKVAPTPKKSMGWSGGELGNSEQGAVESISTKLKGYRDGIGHEKDATSKQVTKTAKQIIMEKTKQQSQPANFDSIIHEEEENIDDLTLQQAAKF